MLPLGGDPGEGLFVEEQISAAEPSADELDLAQRALDTVPFERETSCMPASISFRAQ